MATFSLDASRVFRSVLGMWTYWAPLFHVWRDCGPIIGLWRLIQTEVLAIVHSGLLIHPKVLLVLDFKTVNKKINKEFIANLLAAASILIAKYWKSNINTRKQEGVSKTRFVF